MTRDGYVRNDQNVVMHAGEPVSLAVTLEPSPDTGFELTSEPPGGMVWLDGAPINGGGGQRRAPTSGRCASRPGSTSSRSRARRGSSPGARSRDRAGRHREDPRHAHPGDGRAARPKTGERTGRQDSEKAQRAAPAENRATDPRRRSRRDDRGAPGRTARSSDRGGRAARRRRLPPHAVGASGDLGRAEAVEPPRRPTTTGAGGGECSITVNSVPWSEVWIDGRNTTKHTPVVDYKVPCGKHKLAFKRPDISIDHTESINISRARSSSSATPSKPRSERAGLRVRDAAWRGGLSAAIRRWPPRGPRRWPPPGARITGGRVKRPAHPAARDFLTTTHRGAGAPDPGRRLGAGGGCGEGDCWRRCPTGTAPASTTCPSGGAGAARHPDIAFDVADATAPTSSERPAARAPTPSSAIGSATACSTYGAAGGPERAAGAAAGASI